MQPSRIAETRQTSSNTHKPTETHNTAPNTPNPPKHIKPAETLQNPQNLLEHRKSHPNTQNPPKHTKPTKTHNPPPLIILLCRSLCQDQCARGNLNIMRSNIMRSLRPRSAVLADPLQDTWKYYTIFLRALRAPILLNIMKSNIMRSLGSRSVLRANHEYYEVKYYAENTIMRGVGLHPPRNC